MAGFERIKKLIGHRFKNVVATLVRVLLVVQLLGLPELAWGWQMPAISSELDRELAMRWAILEAQLEAEMLRAMEEVEAERGEYSVLEREIVMESVLEEYEKDREEAMRSALESFSRREEEGFKEFEEVGGPSPVEGETLVKESMEEEGKKAFERIILNGADRKKEIRLELDASIPIVLVFPTQIRQVVVVDESLVGYEKISPKELKIFSKSGLGSTIIYVWDMLGRWLFNVRVVMPKVIEKIERLAEREKERREVLKLSYSTDWWSFYEGEDFDSTERTELGHTQTLSIYGPTAYGDLNASITVEKEGDSYVANYRFISLSHINRFGLEDGKAIVGNYFAEGSQLTFPGTTLDGLYFSERHGDWSVQALYGETEDYWNYVPLIGQEMAKIRSFRVSYKDLAINYARRSDVDDSGAVSEEAYSVELNTEMWGWGVSGELAHDQEKWAGLLELRGKLFGWNSDILLKDVEAGYRTISGVPIYSGEFGIETTFDKLQGEDYYSIYANVFRDKEFPNPHNPDKFNVEFTAQWERRKEERLYGLLFDYDDYTGTSSAFKTYRLEAYHRLNFELFKLPFIWTVVFSHTDNRDEVLGRRFFVERLSNRFDWTLIPGLLNVYSAIDFGQVKEKHGRRSHPRVIDSGLSLYRRSKDGKWSWNFSGGYRYESHGGMPYSFSSNQDMLYLSSRLDWELAPGRSWFVEANVKKYYPREGGNSVRLELYTGLRWAWDTKINLLPKVKVWGYVFEDKNLNGKMDDGEVGLPNVEVMADGKKVKSDAEGKYDLGWIRAEKIVLRINGADLPLGMFPEKDNILVSPADGKEQRIDFPVRYITGIRVFAFVDSNENGQLDPGEELVDGIRVCVDDKCRYTDLQGSLAIADLSPGEHELTLDLTSLPEGLFPATPVRIKVRLSRGEEKKVYIPLRGK